MARRTHSRPHAAIATCNPRRAGSGDNEEMGLYDICVRRDMFGTDDGLAGDRGRKGKWARGMEDRTYGRAAGSAVELEDMGLGMAR